MPGDEYRSPRWVVAGIAFAILTSYARAQELPPALGPSDPAEIDARLLQRLDQLEREVQEVHSLRNQVQQLQNEVQTLRSNQSQPPQPSLVTPPGPPDYHSLMNGNSSGDGQQRSQGGGGGEGSSGGGGSGSGYSGGAGSGALSTSGGGGGGSGGGQGSVGRGSRVGSRSPAGYDIDVKYLYNFAGGYFSLSDEDDEFVLNIQNMLVADGTFLDRQEAPTRQKGFNIPFQRLYLYGNITKNWEYQISEQSSLGSFNLLDLLVNVHYDDRIMFKFGRFLAPFYYQDYATFPMLVPTISYSSLFQFSAQRQVGAMIWGKVAKNRMQYQIGVFNGIPDGYFDFDTHKDFAGSLTFTPFMQDDREWLQNLGFGVSTETGRQDYRLNRVENLSFIAGAGSPSTNSQYVNANGIPFFKYNSDVVALGERTRIAPHLFWYGRFSFLGEYVIQSRTLADPFTRGISVQRGFYVQTSYFLTGERNTGDGTGGFPTIIPNRPLNVSQGEYGIGAWEIAAQFSELNVGDGDIRRGFADPKWATRLDELMVGVNWWPNKYVRVSFDWVLDVFNKPIPWPINDRPDPNTNPIDRLNIFWGRVAFFF